MPNQRRKESLFQVFFQPFNFHLIFFSFCCCKRPALVVCFSFFWKVLARLSCSKYPQLTIFSFTCSSFSAGKEDIYVKYANDIDLSLSGFIFFAAARSRLEATLVVRRYGCEDSKLVLKLERGVRVAKFSSLDIPECYGNDDEVSLRIFKGNCANGECDRKNRLYIGKEYQPSRKFGLSPLSESFLLHDSLPQPSPKSNEALHRYTLTKKSQEPSLKLFAMLRKMRFEVHFRALKGV